MNRDRILDRVVLLLAALVAAVAVVAEEPTDPLRTNVTEEIRVRLVILDAVVLDSDGRTVDGLGAEDFEIRVAGRPVEVDTLDVDCSAGSLGEPVPVSRVARREALPAPENGRRIVLAFDYPHMHQLTRTEVLVMARDMVRHVTQPGDEVMLVALTGGLRIEQDFDDDPQTTFAALKRMEYDISLWQPSFEHTTELGFFASLEALVDLLGVMPGPKGVVLFSNIPGSADQWDAPFAELSARAAASRVVFYPVHAAGLLTPFDSAGLPTPGGG
ncbi:MAG: hypothetical protein GY716_08085 [bacterium]|nr:hypothetical protein [bacterium]